MYGCMYVYVCMYVCIRWSYGAGRWIVEGEGADDGGCMYVYMYVCMYVYVCTLGVWSGI